MTDSRKRKHAPGPDTSYITIYIVFPVLLSFSVGSFVLYIILKETSNISSSCKNKKIVYSKADCLFSVLKMTADDFTE